MDHFIITSILLIMLVAWIWYTTDRAPEEKVHQETLDHVKSVLQNSRRKKEPDITDLPIDYFSQPNPSLIQEAIKRGYPGATLQGTKTPLTKNFGNNKALYFPKSDTLEISTITPGIYFIVYKQGRWTPIKEEPKDHWRVKSFEDLKSVTGYFNNCDGAYGCTELSTKNRGARDIFPKKEHAEGVILLAQILQLVEAYNKGTVTKRKYVIQPISGGSSFFINYITDEKKAISFTSIERAQAFREDHHDLLTNFFTKINI